MSNRTVLPVQFYAIDTENVQKFIPKEIRKMISNGELTEEEALSFSIIFPSPKKAAEIQDNILQTEGIGRNKREKTCVGSLELTYLRTSLRGWNNFYDRNGVEIKWQDDTIEKNIAKLSPALRSEIAEFISNGTYLSEEEEKN